MKLDVAFFTTSTFLFSKRTRRTFDRPRNAVKTHDARWAWELRFDPDKRPRSLSGRPCKQTDRYNTVETQHVRLHTKVTVRQGSIARTAMHPKSDPVADLVLTCTFVNYRAKWSTNAIGRSTLIADKLCAAEYFNGSATVRFSRRGTL